MKIYFPQQQLARSQTEKIQKNSYNHNSSKIILRILLILGKHGILFFQKEPKKKNSVRNKTISQEDECILPSRDQILQWAIQI